ncbi:MAG: DUF2868 domain-containing protein [Campylobacterota bacterium]|nr:DUF2868 domain-containing protein [Campylobacterota bacterium]
MNLTFYLNLCALLKQNPASRESNRAFGLAHVLIKNKPFEQLVTWTDTYKETLKKPLLSETYASYLYGVTYALIVIAFVLGLLSGIGLLSYSGDEPVNVVYFMAMVAFLPLLTMTLTFFSMFRAGSMRSVLVHLSPAFWMEKALSFLPDMVQENIKAVKINPLLANWIIIQRSQLIALFFSLGLFLALIMVVVTKDIAFSWSTTLHITPEAFHHFLYALSLPWRELFPSAVPSLELIEQSQYFRLGDTLSEDMIKHAHKLGEWWKYLALMTIFYAVILRLLMLMLSIWGLKRAVKKSCLVLPGAVKLLSEINEPIISTHAYNTEAPFMEGDHLYRRTLTHLDTSYDVVQGWAMSKEALLLLSDTMKVIAPVHFEVGGMNTLAEDSEMISKSDGEVLLFVKSWEPPTMDFIDYLKELTQKVDKVIIVPVGTLQKSYVTTSKEMDIWARKLITEDDAKVWLKQ